MAKMLKLYAYPYGKQRKVAFVAAPTLQAAKAFHREAKRATIDSLEAALASTISIDAVNYSGKLDTNAYAEPENFGHQRLLVGRT